MVNLSKHCLGASLHTFNMVLAWTSSWLGPRVFLDHVNCPGKTISLSWEEKPGLPCYKSVHVVRKTCWACLELQAPLVSQSTGQLPNLQPLREPVLSAQEGFPEGFWMHTTPSPNTALFKSYRDPEKKTDTKKILDSFLPRNSPIFSWLGL